MTMARVTMILLTAAAIVAAAHVAGADPSGYLAPEGDRDTVERAARAFREGVQLLEKGSAGPALGKFRRAATLCPGFFEARYNVAKLEGERGGRERAIAELEALGRDFPSNVRAFSDLGQLLVESDVEAAGRAFGTAVANGEKLLKDKAIIDAGPGTVAQLRVDLAFAYHNRGAWRLAAGELDAAVADLERSIELNGTNFFSHYGLGLARLQQGDYAAAKASFRLAKALKSPFPDCSIGLARAYLGETPPQPAAAIAELGEAEKAAGATAQSETLYGDAYRLLGKLDAAVEHYGKALDLGADAATISLKLAVVARDQKDFKTARERLRECIEHTTDNALLARAQQHLGELDELEEDFEAAAKHFAAAVALDPDAHGARSIERRLHLGVCLYRMGRLDEAEEHLAVVIERCGDEPPPALVDELALARKLLDKIRASGENEEHSD
jgi:tetratricopeptide (TPR) repeat protein